MRGGSAYYMFYNPHNERSLSYNEACYLVSALRAPFQVGIRSCGTLTRSSNMGGMTVSLALILGFISRFGVGLTMCWSRSMTVTKA